MTTWLRCSICVPVAQERNIDDEERLRRLQPQLDPEVNSKYRI